VRFVPTLLHGMVDYAVGVFLIALSFFIGWSGMAGWLVAVAGAAAIFYAALTDYELGITRIMPVRLHLGLDAAFGVAMFALGRIVAGDGGFAWVFYSIGMAAIILAVVTKIKPAAYR